jgi:hypothetical protein
MSRLRDGRLRHSHVGEIRPASRQYAQAGCDELWHRLGRRRYRPPLLGTRIELRTALKKSNRRTSQRRDHHHQNNPDHEAGEPRIHREHCSGGCASKQVNAPVRQADRNQDPEIRLDGKILDPRGAAPTNAMYAKKIRSTIMHAPDPFPSQSAILRRIQQRSAS